MWLLAYRRHAHGHTATEPQPTVRSLYKRRTRYSRYLSVLTHSEHTRLCLYATVLPSNHGYPAAINVAVPVDYIDTRSKGSGPKRNLFRVQGKPRCRRCDQQRVKVRSPTASPNVLVR